MENSLREKPERHNARRLSDHLKLDGKKKVHSLVDKVYQRTNLEIAWKRVKANRGAGGADGVTVEEFEKDLEANLERLHQELREGRYLPQPVRRLEIPKRGDPGKTRPLGIPSVFDRVCQQALVNRIEPIFEEVFDAGSFGYRKGRQTRDALKKIWHEIEEGNEWIVDADLKDYFGSVDHEKLIALVAQRISDGRVLKLIQQMLEAGYIEQGSLFPTSRGTPQGGVVSPCLSNVLLTPFDKEMRRKGYRLTRWADDWVVTCRTRSEAVQALATATKILQKLGVTLNAKKTRIVNIKQGFEFLGFKIGQGKGVLRLPASKIKAKLNKRNLYALPKDKSVTRFKDAVRQKTRRRSPLTTEEIVKELNPLIRGWGNYYKRSNVRRLFNQLDAWIIRRLWSQRNKKWRTNGWRTLSTQHLREDLKLVSLIWLIPSLQAAKARS
ncbi:MAG: group II intron reverse transcriptase/maturase [Chlamydiae bacterium RIFCSPHIGHO2_12_FULL_49_32]|nr:MAG: group II intron reverse transcriptase/maturase [Chlamydiae bacterium RIFCSPHIGHO2_12_FULL_49_32]